MARKIREFTTQLPGGIGPAAVAQMLGELLALTGLVDFKVGASGSVTYRTYQEEEVPFEFSAPASLMDALSRVTLEELPLPGNYAMGLLQHAGSTGRAPVGWLARGAEGIQPTPYAPKGHAGEQASWGLLGLPGYSLEQLEPGTLVLCCSELPGEGVLSMSYACCVRTT